MSHKRSNEQLRTQRLVGELAAALDSAAWQAERDRQQAWVREARMLSHRQDGAPDPGAAIKDVER
jgi:hypothetical protein